MNCQECHALAEDLIDKRLDDAARIRIASHLAKCAPCAAALERRRAAHAALFRALNHPSNRPALPPDFADRLAAACRRPPAFWRRFTPPRWTLVAASLAAAVLAGFAAVWLGGALLAPPAAVATSLSTTVSEDATEQEMTPMKTAERAAAALAAALVIAPAGEAGAFVDADPAEARIVTVTTGDVALDWEWDWAPDAATVDVTLVDADGTTVAAATVAKPTATYFWAGGREASVRATLAFKDDAGEAVAVFDAVLLRRAAADQATVCDVDTDSRRWGSVMPGETIAFDRVWAPGAPDAAATAFTVAGAAGTSTDLPRGFFRWKRPDSAPPWAAALGVGDALSFAATLYPYAGMMLTLR